MLALQVSRSWLLAAIVSSCPLWAGTIHHSPQEASFSPTDRVLAVGDQTAKKLFLINPASPEIQRTIELDGAPTGLAWSSDGNRLFAAESGAGSIAEINPHHGTVTRRITTGRYPSALALAPKRNLLLTTNHGLNRLSIINLESGKTIATIPTGRLPSDVAVSPDESLAVVSNLIPATAATNPNHATEVTIVDLQQLKATATVRLPTGSTNSREICISHDGTTAYVTHTVGRFHLPTTQLDRGWVNTNALSIIDLKQATLKGTVLLDQATDGAADPWGVATNPDGKHLYVTLSGVHQLAVINIHSLQQLLTNTDPTVLANELSVLHRNGIIQRVDLPATGPRGVAVSHDGSQVAVCGYFSSNLVLLDREGNNSTSIAIGEPTEPDLIRRGEIAYYDADKCFQRWLSCASCHPNTRADGLNWDLLNDGIGNPKNARSMVLSHLTPPVMSLGVREKMEVAVRAGFIHIQFSEPDPERLESVIAYLKSLEPDTSPHRMPDGSLSEAATRGKKIFHRKSVGCASCHPQPLLTNLGMFNVGTNGPFDAENSRFDTPTLHEIWRTPPYLHDGRSKTLREMLTQHNPDDRHGKTSHLKPNEIDDLAAYLLSL